MHSDLQKNTLQICDQYGSVFDYFYVILQSTKNLSVINFLATRGKPIKKKTAAANAALGDMQAVD